MKQCQTLHYLEFLWEFRNSVQTAQSFFVFFCFFIMRLSPKSEFRVPFAVRTPLCYPTILSTLCYLTLFPRFPPNTGLLPKRPNIFQYYNDHSGSQREERRWRWGYRQDELRFLLQRSKTIAFYLHLKNAEQLFTAWVLQRKLKRAICCLNLWKNVCKLVRMKFWLTNGLWK